MAGVDLANNITKSENKHVRQSVTDFCCAPSWSCIFINTDFIKWHLSGFKLMSGYSQRNCCLVVERCVLQVGGENCKPSLVPTFSNNVSLGLTGTDCLFSSWCFLIGSLWNWTTGGIGWQTEGHLTTAATLHLDLYIMKLKVWQASSWQVFLCHTEINAIKYHCLECPIRVKWQF